MSDDSYYADYFGEVEQVVVIIPVAGTFGPYAAIALESLDGLSIESTNYGGIDGSYIFYKDLEVFDTEARVLVSRLTPKGLKAVYETGDPRLIELLPEAERVPLVKAEIAVSERGISHTSPECWTLVLEELGK